MTLPNIRWALLYGVVLTNARAIGEFGAVSVVSGSIRGETLSLPLQIELLEQDYNTVGSFTAAALLTLMAIITLFLKSMLQWRLENQENARNRRKIMSIEIARIKKSFGRTQVLNDISLDIPSGQMVALLGPSGSGKRRCCALLPGWSISPAVIFVSTVRTLAACTRVSVKSVLCFSTMRCFAI